MAKVQSRVRSRVQSRVPSKVPSVTLARASRWLANLLLAGLVVYLAVVLARVSWLVAWQDRPLAPVTSQPAGASGARLAGQSLAAYELFGRPQGQARVADVVREAAPKTRLKLRLEGVLLAERPEESGAIVAGSDGETAHYRVGDMLPGNAELAEVEPSQILIRRNGKYETLTFEESVATGMVEEAPVEQVRDNSPDAFLADARERLDSQGAQALATYGLKPAEEGGSSGYVYDGSNALLNAVNLKSGDVITAVNGQPLGDLQQDMMLLESWRNEAQLMIEIQRDGATMTVTYAIPEQWR